MKETVDNPPNEAAPQEAATPEPLGLRARKKARLKQELARIVLDLHRELGAEGATLEEICRRAEISHPTFYKYYPSKEAVLTEHAMRGLPDLLATTLERSGPIEPRLLDYADALAGQLVRERSLWQAVAVSNAYSPARDPVLLASIEAGSRALQSAFATAQRDGELTRDFSSQTLAALFEGMLLRLCIAYCAGPEPGRALESAVTEALAFFMRSARAQ